MITKFFRNQVQNTLINKIVRIFQLRQIHFFGTLLEYFRASGYFRTSECVKNPAYPYILSQNKKFRLSQVQRYKPIYC